MIKKIISGGQSGADRAALDFAIKMDIPHGGWIPKGRLAEDSPLSDKYNLKEMSTKSYPKRTEQNVIDSNGTLIISRGRLTGGSDYTRKMACKHNKPWFHVNLTETPAFEAAEQIIQWVELYEIQILNVAGPRASKDATIYKAVMDLLKAVYYMAIAEGSYAAMRGAGAPKTVDEAVNRLMANMPLKMKAEISKMDAGDLIDLHATIGAYIRNQFKLWTGNFELLDDCCKVTGYEKLHPDEAAGIIVKELWRKLRETHKLRAVK